ncbi:MAG: hypothetical protein V4681_00670 [Patescibacteria group bacterium]
MRTRPPRGYLLLLGLVFGAIFLTVLGSLASFVLTENRLQNVSTERARAFSLAEAGLEYYRWFLAHYPGNLTNGTGVPGPYVLSYNDPEGGTAGTVTLAVTGNLACGQVTSIDLASTGQPTGSNVSRTISVRYTRPTVGQYSYILNDTVWAGSDRVISGPYHSNGGVRMDGTANAPVTSSLSSWLCTSSFGCSPNSTEDGVFGAGPNQTLWSYPTPQVNFAGIAADFSALKTAAQTQSMLYFARTSVGSNNTQANYWNGYRLIFNAAGTVTVRRVTGTTNLTSTALNTAEDALHDRALVTTDTLVGTYQIPDTCGLIFVEDNVWLEGTITKKVTVVAANVVDAGIAPNAYLKNNIVYQATDGTDGLTVIAEDNVLITPDSPNTMTLNGIFIAQGGAFGRNYYSGCSASYEPKTTLTIRGTTVSSKRTGTKWMGGCSNYAGYGTRIDAYDRQLATNPPPFTPVVSNDYQFVDWREE